MKTAARKKYRIKNKFRFITFCTVFILILSFGISSIFGLASADGSDARNYVSVKVEKGDTLWNLAAEYGPSNVDIRRVIYEIKSLNNMETSDLQVGQYITIPVGRI